MAKQDILKKIEDRIWLVKSSDVILGPFTIAELAQNVRSKNVRLLDEARTPQQRWLFIRDVAEIQSTISKMAQQEETFEKTYTSATQTQGLSVTRNLDDDLTPIPDQPVSIKSPAANEKLTKVIPLPAVTQGAAPATSSVPVKSYSVNPPGTPIPWGKWGMYAFVGLAFLAAVFSFAQRKAWESDQKKTWSEFQQLYVAQLYDDAYKKLKEYQREFPDQAAALTRAGFLYLNPGHELVNAKRMFDRSSQLEPNNKDLMVQNLNGMGLVALYDGQMVQAKSYFDRAITLEPGSVATRFNIISLDMSQGQWDDAFTLAEQTVHSEPKKAYLIEAAISLLSSAHIEKVKPIYAGLDKSIDSSAYLRPVVRLMMVKLASMHSDAMTLENKLKLFFEDIPSLHIAFTENPIIDQRWRDWNFLFQFCNDLHGPANLAADLAAMQIICTAQIQKYNEAEDLLNESLKRFPNNPKVFLAQLHLLASMNRWSDIRALMKTASLTSDTAVNWIFARSCVEEKNKSCADLYLNPLMQKSQISTATYTLQAQRVCAEKVSDSCRFAITQGLAQDPSAYDLLKIKFQIESGM
jgi:tetratricopeptide (TPR) repeat protein